MVHQFHKGEVFKYGQGRIMENRGLKIFNKNISENFYANINCLTFELRI